MANILYSGLIGAISVLFITLIFKGIPAFIRFIVKKLTKSKDREE